ncbi:tetraspanin-36-like [Discoglossus pictus]
MGLAVFTSKSFLLLLSLIFMGAAAGLCYVGVTLISTYRHYEDFLSNSYLMLPAVITLCVSVLMFIIGILGCCSTLKESGFGMGCFLVLISIIFAAGVVSLILGLVYRDKINPGLEDNMNTLFQKYDGKNLESSAIDFMQKEIMCCGVKNYTDWMKTPWYNASNPSVPISCCMKNRTACTGKISETNQIYHEGCDVKLEHVLQSILSYALLVLLGFAIIELLGIISICVIMCKPAAHGYQLL